MNKINKSVRELIIVLAVVLLVTSIAFNIYFAVKYFSFVDNPFGPVHGNTNSVLEVNVYDKSNNKSTSSLEAPPADVYKYRFNSAVYQRYSQIINNFNINDMFYHIKSYGIMGEMITGVYLAAQKKGEDQGTSRNGYFSWQLGYYNVLNKKYELAPGGISEIKTVSGFNGIQLFYKKIT